MNVFIYTGESKEYAPYLLKAVEDQTTSHKPTIIPAIDEMETILRQRARNSDIAILLSTAPAELEKFIQLRKILEDVRLILILRQGSNDDIGKWHLLRPRYLDRETGNDFSNVGIVLKKMLAT